MRASRPPSPPVAAYSIHILRRERPRTEGKPPAPVYVTLNYVRARQSTRAHRKKMESLAATPSDYSFCTVRGGNIQAGSGRIQQQIGQRQGNTVSYVMCKHGNRRTTDEKHTETENPPVFRPQLPISGCYGAFFQETQGKPVVARRDFTVPYAKCRLNTDCIRVALAGPSRPAGATAGPA
jgi:hypothetical protein